MTMIRFSIDQLPKCCGFLEVGCMDSFDDGTRREDIDIFCNEFFLELEEVLPKILSEAKGRPVIFNFVKPRVREQEWDENAEEFRKNVRFRREYTCKELRALVKEYPGVVHLHTWENPNTFNRIDSYVIKTTKE